MVVIFTGIYITYWNFILLFLCIGIFISSIIVVITTSFVISNGVDVIIIVRTRNVRRCAVINGLINANFILGNSSRWCGDNHIAIGQPLSRKHQVIFSSSVANVKWEEVTVAHWLLTMTSCSTYSICICTLRRYFSVIRRNCMTYTCCVVIMYSISIVCCSIIIITVITRIDNILQIGL